jgi:hypothetical protein
LAARLHEGRSFGRNDDGATTLRARAAPRIAAGLGSRPVWIAAILGKPARRSSRNGRAWWRLAQQHPALALNPRRPACV